MTSVVIGRLRHESDAVIVAAILSFGIAALIAQIELFAAALYLCAQSAPRFDMTVAAETLVARGVFSLIVSIVLAVIATPDLNITAGSVTLDDGRPPHDVAARQRACG
jgi:uncharacterized PurR-regulated membrane protein YhhQ (DUF165 family)